jgi:hypothetical protein
MRIMQLSICACFAAALCHLALAEQVVVSPAVGAVNIFSKPIQLRGKLGKDQVQMRLQPKLEDADSVEGSYIVAGGKRNKGQKILLAGEVSGSKLTMEESEDGVDVSGQWDGEFQGHTLRGVWQSDDGKRSEDFVLELMPVKTKKVTKY